MKLYNYWRSTSSHRVRIALHLKGIPYEYVAVNLLEGKQHEADHRARSPMSKVPVLELDDGHRITESMAIIEYLDDIQATPPLLPRDPYLRARARMLAEMVNSGIQPLQNRSLNQYIKKVLGADDKTFTHHWIEQGLHALEVAVAETASRFCVGDEPSLADVYVVPQMLGSRRFGVDVEVLPTLRRIEDACAELKGFKDAAPDRQPDAQPGA